ncbi:MAG: hypothetical protein AB7S78_09635 [Candidatus Omnitrophota bacterium]
MKRKQYQIIIAIALFTISRVSYIFFLKDTDIASNQKIIESQYIGLVAKHLQEGLIMPFWDYQFSSYDGGTLITGLVLAPFFHLFGQSSFTLSFYALIISLIVFLIWWRFSHIYYGERIGLFVAMLFIFAPPIHIKANGVASGNHMEINFFVSLVVFFFYKIFFFFQSKNNPLKRFKSLDFIFLGFISGLGVYFCYSLGLVLLTCFLFWITIDKQPFKNYHYLLLGCFYVLGFSFAFPRLPVFNSLIIADIFSQWPLSNFASFGERFTGVITKQLPPLIAVASPLHILTFYIFSISFLFLLFKNLKTLGRQLIVLAQPKFQRLNFDHSIKNNFILLFLMIYILTYTLSNFNTYLEFESPIRHRYLLLLYPFIFIVIAESLNSLYLWKNPLGKRLTVLLFIYFFIASIHGTLRQLDFNNAKQKIIRRFTEDGFSHEMLGTVICSRFGGFPEKSLPLLNSVKNIYIPEMYRGFGYEFSMMDYHNLKEYKKLIVSKPYQKEFLKGIDLGRVTNEYFKGTDVDRAYLADVMGYGACQEPEMIGNRLLSLLDPVTVTDKSQYYKGIGMILAIQCDILDDTEFKFIKKIDSKYYQAFYEGVGEGRKYNLNILSILGTP